MSTTNIETEAIIVAKPGDDFKLGPIILDEVRGNEVLVEMKYSGICHTVSVFRARSSEARTIGRTSECGDGTWFPQISPDSGVQGAF